MKLRVKETIEIVGVFAVVASLIFVGMQLYFDRQVALAEQYSNRAESMKSDLRSQLESDVYMNERALIWDAGVRPTLWNDKLAARAELVGYGGKEVRSQIIVNRLMLLQFDNLYFQYQQDLLTEDSWKRMRQLVKNILSNENGYGRYVYQEFSSPLLIQPLIEEILLEIENEAIQ